MCFVRFIMKIEKKFEPIISGISAALVIGFLGYLTLETPFIAEL